MADPRIYYVNEEDCKVWVLPAYLTPEEDVALHAEIKALPLIQHHLGKMYGKDTWQPRLSIGLGKEYAYSGKVHPAVPWEQSPLAKSFCDKINRDFDRDFTGGLVNYYRTGLDHISAHSDDEQTLAKGGGVFGLSTHCERDMVMRWLVPNSRKVDKERPRIVIPLPPGSLFAMEGATQKRMTHEMPVRKAASDRGSVTYRRYL
jgi:alkylated DNA repair dioxygenase AlkB